MSSLPTKQVTPEEYLERERLADSKSEYLSGEIFAMAVASRTHNMISWVVADDRGGEDTILLSSIGCALSLADAYNKVIPEPPVRLVLGGPR